MSVLTRVALAFSAALVFAGCVPPPDTGSSGEAKGVLRVGLLPDEDPRRQAKRYAPLIDAIRGKTGLGVELVLPTDYAQLVDLFAAGDVDLAHFGGYTFVLASERSDAKPLVMRDIDRNFVSYVLVHEENANARELSDLRDARLSFGPRHSTSGHLMPRYYFARRGITPEKFFARVTYSGGHDHTLQRVADGTVDAGVINGQFVQMRLNEGSSNLPRVRVIWQSPPYVNYVWAIQPSVTQQTQQALTEVFLSLSRDDEDARQFLYSVGARYYLPATDSDFDDLRHIVKTLKSTAG